jgi:hypothetical protein
VPRDHSKLGPAALVLCSNIGTETGELIHRFKPLLEAIGALPELRPARSSLYLQTGDRTTF